MCADLASSDEERNWKECDISDESRSPSPPEIDLKYSQKGKKGNGQHHPNNRKDQLEGEILRKRFSYTLFLHGVRVCDIIHDTVKVV